MAAPLKQCFCRILQNKGISHGAKQYLPLISKEQFISTSKVHYNDGKTVDPGAVFISEEVQNLLKKLTRFDMDKIFMPRPTKEFGPPEYRLLTTAQLQEIEEESYRKAIDRLQMPPYLKASEDIEHVLSDDQEIAGLETNPIVFTDISLDVPLSERLVLVRETGGKLRMANHRERDRILHVYYPREGKTLHMPEMFQDGPLENLLKEGQHEYILDRACVQFEPNDPEYIRVTHRTYEYLNSVHDYDSLRSTRHFGPLCFYLAHYRKMEGLLVDMIQRDMVHDAADMVKIYHKLHTDSKSIDQMQQLIDPIETIQCYLDHDSLHPEAVQLAIQTYKDSLSSQRQNIQQ